MEYKKIIEANSFNQGSRLDKFLMEMLSNESINNEYINKNSKESNNERNNANSKESSNEGKNVSRVARRVRSVFEQRGENTSNPGSELLPYSTHVHRENSSLISRTFIKKLIDNGNVKVNGTTQKASYKVTQKDIIEISLEKPAERLDIKPQEINLDVIYEDKDIIVINKPKGLVVHPGNGNPEGTLVNAIMARCKGSLSGIGGEIRPGIVHRLDKDTSGVIIVAKNDNAHINLSTQIKNREVKKTYIALVRGVVKETHATIDMPIGRHMNVRVKMAVRKDGKSAITHFNVLKRYESYTLLEINIETGRTHQIRVHLAEIGHPVVGDMVYSNGKNPFNVEGQMLHASKIEFKHPTTGAMMTVEAKLPEYFEDVILKLDKKGRDYGTN